MKLCNSNAYNGCNKFQFSLLLAFSSSIGFLLSLYATHVEYSIEADANYTAMCDISEKISCTKVFSSSYGKGFGFMQYIVGKESDLNVPNGLAGVLVYAMMIIMSFINYRNIAKIQYIVSITSVLLSFYLAYLLYFVLDDFCIVCVSTYAVNFINLILSYKRYNILNQEYKKYTKKNL